MVHIDALRLRQIVLNLTSNAIKFNRAGGQVTLSLRRHENAGVTVCVIDTGIGMTPAQLARLYEPFNRLGRESGNAPGRGLGLAICRQLTDAMGLQLHVTSTAGQGTTFTLHLP